MPVVKIISRQELTKLAGDSRVNAYISDEADILYITKSTPPEVVAHELGHIAIMPSLEIDESNWTWKDFIRDELGAWIWASQKRERKLRTDFPWKVLYRACDEYSAKPSEAIELVVEMLKGTRDELSGKEISTYRSALKSYFG